MNDDVKLSVPLRSLADNDRVVAKEYRFSIVMYGGVSLAIYMNGIAQELLHMVRSTARTSWDNDAGTDFRYSTNGLRSTERVYREVARVLNDSNVDDVRFVIDLISGTSAGGINGVFLAKALTDDSLNFDVLQNLWVTEGALEKLLNDDPTADDSRLPRPDPPKSLLSSDRMYIKLLDALMQMEATKKDGSQPLSQEIDLFVTTTDITGRVIPLRLSDRLVYERKYKADFHFHYQKPEGNDPDNDKHNDLKNQNNPFIAFITRCTSSFPFAFEPMQLCKLTDLQITKAWPAKLEVPGDQLKEWESKFFDNSAQVPTGSNRTRAFGDGGYLNNKPFSFVVEMLGRHSATFPTERNLIYVEPTPDHPESEARLDTAAAQQGTNAPNALANSYDALMKLPGYQAIHDDLQRVIERNRLVRKVSELSSAITTKMDGVGVVKRMSSAPAEVAPSLYMTPRFALLNENSAGDFGYLNLCVYSTTDELSKVLSQWFNYPTSSSYYYGIRCLVRAWRENNFHGTESKAGGETATYNTFLSRFDIDYEKRHYRFVRQQINIFYAFDQNARDRLRKGFGVALEEGSSEFRDEFRKALIALKKPFDEASGIINEVLRRIRPGYQPEPTDSEGKELVDAIENLKDVVKEFKKQNIAANLENNPSGAIVPASASGQSSLPNAIPGKSLVEYVLGVEKQSGLDSFAPAQADVDEDYVGRASKALRSKDSGLDAAVERVANAISAIFDRAVKQSRSRVREQWDRLTGSLHPTRGANIAKTIVSFFYAHFESFDAAIFPMTYDTDVGVPELIKILRVSPDDAGSIYNQLDNPTAPKLAGTGLAHFGAFLDRSFRTNDILWGRLDGAERIIRALLGDGKSASDSARVDVDGLIQEAHEIIVADFLTERQDALAGVMIEVAKSLNLDPTEPRKLSPSEIAAIQKRVIETLSPLSLGKVDLSPKAVINYLKNPPPKREPDPRTTLESITRSIRVVGGILEGVSKETKVAGGFLIRAATAMWWLAEAAVPNGLVGHFFRKIITALFWFEIVMVVGGTIFSQPMQSLGIKLLAFTTLLWLFKDACQNFLLSGSSGLKKTIAYTILAIVIALSVWGGLAVFGDKLPLIKHWKGSTAGSGASANCAPFQECRLPS